jgi:hypothetical protein
MSTSKQLKEARKVALAQQSIVGELQALARDIERCERTILTLQRELEQVNVKHAGRTTTQDDINYLEDVLSCAKRKLVWEKQIASLQKRTPELMQRVEALVNHPQSSPDEQTRKALMESLHQVQGAMHRLQGGKTVSFAASGEVTSEPEPPPNTSENGQNSGDGSPGI